MSNFSYDIATVKESSFDVINALLEILIMDNFELPAFSTLEHLAHKVRTSALDYLFTTVVSNLTPAAQEELDGLLVLKSENELTLLART